MGELRIHSTLNLETIHGKREIQLLFGDICKLPIKDKVDVIVISAFPGDYSPTPTSVIGALRHNFDLNVRDLAKNKAEDLRRHFHCWWSHPLPEALPYSRLLCFESTIRGRSHPAQLVGDIYRAMIPAFIDDEKTVITPLIATGDQNFSKIRMMKAMVDAAVNWIKSGLALKCLKIVLYTRRPDKLTSEEVSVVELFAKLKKNYETKNSVLAEPALKYDLYISYNELDKAKVKEIISLLKARNEKIKIFSKHQGIVEKAAYQTEMYQVMVTCARVMTVLSPVYLESEACIEQYNLALCCNRQTKRDLLAPYYIETISPMPTYMCLVQYIDCRLKDGVNTKMLRGIDTFIVDLEQVKQMQKEKKSNAAITNQSNCYDVFISYSHRNTEKATKVLNLIETVAPDAKIFFDRNELKTGGAWQQTLYEGIDNTSVVITLLSPDYIKSAVCQEEYNLALTKYLSEDYETELLPIVIEPLDEEALPRHFKEVKAIDATQQFDDVIKNICHPSVQNYLMSKVKDATVFCDTVKLPYMIDEILESHRLYQFKQKYTILENDQIEPVSSSQDQESTSQNCNIPEQTGNSSNADIVILQAQDKQACVDALVMLLQRESPTLKISQMDYGNDHDEVSLLASLDEAKMVVALLSHSFIVTERCVMAFNIALCRHRSEKSKVLYPIQVDPLPQWPTYFRMIPTFIACHDMLWEDLIVKFDRTLNYGENVLNIFPGLEECVARLPAVSLIDTMWLSLAIASHDILEELKAQSKESQKRNTIINNIVQVYQESDRETFEMMYPKKQFIVQLKVPVQIKEQTTETEPLGSGKVENNITTSGSGA
ncbi:unnamed protein product [Owenia fusiformis]|uniref:TIR domain-containing protein n=1 Tax=Owenia fusiformis TaxID=6347 RepID=A0A8S4PZE3_OWEFU|nr:unnamed protein product [Owenia fusiformis]